MEGIPLTAPFLLQAAPFDTYGSIPGVRRVDVHPYRPWVLGLDESGAVTVYEVGNIATGPQTSVSVAVSGGGGDVVGAGSDAKVLARISLRGILDARRAARRRSAMELASVESDRSTALSSLPEPLRGSDEAGPFPAWAEEAHSSASAALTARVAGRQRAIELEQGPGSIAEVRVSALGVGTVTGSTTGSEPSLSSPDDEGWGIPPPESVGPVIAVGFWPGSSATQRPWVTGEEKDGCGCGEAGEVEVYPKVASRASGTCPESVWVLHSKCLLLVDLSLGSSVLVPLSLLPQPPSSPPTGHRAPTSTSSHIDVKAASYVGANTLVLGASSGACLVLHIAVGGPAQVTQVLWPPSGAGSIVALASVADALGGDTSEHQSSVERYGSRKDVGRDQVAWDSVAATFASGATAMWARPSQTWVARSGPQGLKQKEEKEGEEGGSEAEKVEWDAVLGVSGIEIDELLGGDFATTESAVALARDTAGLRAGWGDEAADALTPFAPVVIAESHMVASGVEFRGQPLSPATALQTLPGGTPLSLERSNGGPGAVVLGARGAVCTLLPPSGVTERGAPALLTAPPLLHLPGDTRSSKPIAVVSLASHPRLPCDLVALASYSSSHLSLARPATSPADAQHAILLDLNSLHPTLPEKLKVYAIAGDPCIPGVLWLGTSCGLFGVGFGAGLGPSTHHIQLPTHIISPPSPSPSPSPSTSTKSPTSSPSTSSVSFFVHPDRGLLLSDGNGITHVVAGVPGAAPSIPHSTFDPPSGVRKLLGKELMVIGAVSSPRISPPTHRLFSLSVFVVLHWPALHTAILGKVVVTQKGRSSSDLDATWSTLDLPFIASSIAFQRTSSTQMWLVYVVPERPAARKRPAPKRRQSLFVRRRVTEEEPPPPPLPPALLARHLTSRTSSATVASEQGGSSGSGGDGDGGGEGEGAASGGGGGGERSGDVVLAESIELQLAYEPMRVFSGPVLGLETRQGGASGRRVFQFCKWPRERKEKEVSVDVIGAGIFPPLWVCWEDGEKEWVEPKRKKKERKGGWYARVALGCRSESQIWLLQVDDDKGREVSLRPWCELPPWPCSGDALPAAFGAPGPPAVWWSRGGLLVWTGVSLTITFTERVVGDGTERSGAVDSDAIAPAVTVVEAIGGPAPFASLAALASPSPALWQSEANPSISLLHDCPGFEAIFTPTPSDPWKRTTQFLIPRHSPKPSHCIKNHSCPLRTALWSAARGDAPLAGTSLTPLPSHVRLSALKATLAILPSPTIVLSANLLPHARDLLILLAARRPKTLPPSLLDSILSTIEAMH